MWSSTWRCLAIQEVVHNIFCHVHTSYDSIYEGRGTLARLARTCKLFKDPALELLWADLPGLSPLLMCMPKDLWAMHETRRELIFIRFIRPTDWEALKRYAPLIRSVSLYDPEHECASYQPAISTDVLRALSLHGPTPFLLPKLHQLIWCDRRAASLQYIHMVLTQSLRHVILRNDSDARMAGAFRAIGAACRLHSFTLDHRDTPSASEHSDALVDAFSDMVMCLDSLNQFFGACIPLRGDAVTSLASRTCLTQAHIDMSQIDCLRDLPDPSFPRLFSMSVVIHDLEKSCLTSLLTTMKSGALLNFWTYAQSLSSHYALHNMLQALSQHQNLTHVILLVNDSHDNPDEFQALDLEVIKPLFALAQMQTFFANLNVDDTAVEYMSRHWPHLQALQLCPSLRCRPSYAHTPRLTPHCLRALARNCPSLTILVLYMDATNIVLDRESVLQLAHEHEHQLTAMNVHGSPIDNPAAVTVLLASYFPQLVSIDFFGARAPETEEYRKRWDQVVKFLHTIRYFRVSTPERLDQRGRLVDTRMGEEHAR